MREFEVFRNRGNENESKTFFLDDIVEEEAKD